MSGQTPSQKNTEGLSTSAPTAWGVDPSANVIALNDAASKRQDDLRSETNQRINDALKHVREVSELRAEHAKEIRQLEADRLEKIRQVDVLAVNTAADRASAAIQALAMTTAANAENLRNALNATATTIASQTANTVQGINERLSALEKSNYEGQGRSKVADPQMQEFMNAVKELRTTGTRSEGKGAGVNMVWVAVLGAAGLVSTLLGIAGVLYAVLKPS